MKTILVDAVNTFVVKTEDGGYEIFEPLRTLLEQLPNKKIILTGANDEQIKKFGLELEKEGLKVFFQKEFMTSLHTDMFTKTKPIARKTKQKVEPKKDESAAALILQRYLDKK